MRAITWCGHKCERIEFYMNWERTELDWNFIRNFFFLSSFVVAFLLWIMRLSLNFNFFPTPSFFFASLVCASVRVCVLVVLCCSSFVLLLFFFVIFFLFLKILFCFYTHAYKSKKSFPSFSERRAFVPAILLLSLQFSYILPIARTMNSSFCTVIQDYYSLYDRTIITQYGQTHAISSYLID